MNRPPGAARSSGPAAPMCRVAAALNLEQPVRGRVLLAAARRQDLLRSGERPLLPVRWGLLPGSGRPRRAGVLRLRREVLRARLLPGGPRVLRRYGWGMLPAAVHLLRRGLLPGHHDVLRDRLLLAGRGMLPCGQRLLCGGLYLLWRDRLLPGGALLRQRGVLPAGVRGVPRQRLALRRSD